VTSWLNTSTALAEMPVSLYNDLKNSYAEYEYAPDVWAKGLPEGQLKLMMRNPIRYKMHLIQKNCAGIKGIYFYTNNRCNVVSENSSLQEDLAEFLFDEKYMYHHEWQTGDIVISDQLLTLHKRQQDDPEILSKRVLNRITFKISNYDNFILKQNTGIGDIDES
jgi:alpha-ketoglutarate-dependent taurine dioxygenase